MRFENQEGLVAPSICLLFVCLYVGSLYLVPKHVRKLSRNDHTHVAYRVTACGLMTVFLPVVVYMLGTEDGNEAELSFGEWFGVRGSGLAAAIVLPVTMVALLFTGPLVYYYQTYEPHHGDKMTDFIHYMDTDPVLQLRNILFAPIMEEVVFRSCMAPLMISSGLSVSAVIFLTPLAFGVAHVHHAVNMVVHNGVPIPQALLMALFQAAYTWLFGTLAMFIFLRTGHLLSVVLVHMFCNTLGLPSTEFMNPRGRLYKKRYQMLGAHVVGIVLFATLLASATDPTLYDNRMWARVNQNINNE